MLQRRTDRAQSNSSALKTGAPFIIRRICFLCDTKVALPCQCRVPALPQQPLMAPNPIHVAQCMRQGAMVSAATKIMERL